MQSFIEFIIRFKSYISFAALVVISLSLISMGNVNKIGGFRTLVIATFGWVQEGFSWIPNPAAIQNENNALRELNLQLSNEVTRMRDAVVENKALRSLLELKKKSDNELIAVSVVGITKVQLRNYLIIDKGKSQGIESGMAMRTDAGIVGTIIGVSDNYSIVETIMNSDVKISSKCLRSDYKGIIVWEGGQYLLMKDVLQSYDVKKGDIIVTSDFSNKYPVNVPIGKVVETGEEEGHLFLKVVVKPFVNFETLEEAFVIKSLPDFERIQLIRELDEKLKLRRMEAGRKDKLIFRNEKAKKSKKKVNKSADKGSKK
jgi:rod shape-determining protein MreC